MIYVQTNFGCAKLLDVLHSPMSQTSEPISLWFVSEAGFLAVVDKHVLLKSVKPF